MVAAPSWSDVRITRDGEGQRHVVREDGELIRERKGTEGEREEEETCIVDVGVGLDGDVSGANVALDGELDALLGGGDDDGVAPGRQVGADALELARRHLHHRLVLRVWDAQRLRLNVQQLQLKVRNFVCDKNEIQGEGRAEGKWGAGVEAGKAIQGRRNGKGSKKGGNGTLEI